MAICADANIQLMDGTMWMHGARTGRMEAVLGDRLSPHGIGPLKAVTSTFCYSGGGCRRCSAKVHGAAPCVSEQGALAFGGQAAARCTQMVLWGPVPSTFALGFRVQMQLCQAEQCCLLLLTVNAAFIQLSLPGAPNVMCSLLRCAMSATGAAVTQAPTKPSCGRRKMVVAARGASQDAQTIPQAVMPLNSSHEAISE